MRVIRVIETCASSLRLRSRVEVFEVRPSSSDPNAQKAPRISLVTIFFILIIISFFNKVISI